MSDSLTPAPSDLERAVAIVRGIEQPRPLAALVFDLVSRQAEGRLLYTGERFVAARAEEHGVDAKAAETPLGNLVGVLERGPETRAQWALVSALFVSGFADAFEALKAQDQVEARTELLSRFSTHAQWLELCTHHRPLSLARELLSDELAAALWQRLGAAVLQQDGAPPGPTLRAQQALRLGALALGAAGAQHGQPCEGARASATDALKQVHGQATDGWTRALAAAALAGRSLSEAEHASPAAQDPPEQDKPAKSEPAKSERAQSEQRYSERESRASDAARLPSGALAPNPADEALAAVRIAGVLARAPRVTLATPLRWLSGFAVLRWAIAGLAALLGVRRHAFVELQGQALSVRVATRWLGRTVRTSDVVHALGQIASVRRVARFASLHLLLGVTVFAASVLLGGYLIGDGLRAQDRGLLLAGSGLLLGGALLDLVLSVLVPAAARRVRIELDFGPRGRMHIAGVPAADADALMHALLEQVATGAAEQATTAPISAAPHAA